MLTKDLLRVSRAGGGFHPQFTDADDEALAGRVLDVYRNNVGERRETLQEAISDVEREADDFKLVRGFAKLVEREATFEPRSPIDPVRTRTAAFEAAEAVGVVSEEERTTALDETAARLGATTSEVEASLFADREIEQVLVSVDSGYDAGALRRQYDLSLAQTALFDATEVRVRSSDPKALVSAVKRLRLMYEVRRTDEGREVVVTGPDALFRRSRRYGTRFARLLRTVVKTVEWHLAATIDDRGTERLLELETGDVSVPGTDPVAEPTFDSAVESDFYARFSSLDLDWDVVREPEPLAAGEYVVIPDFAFDWKHGDVDASDGDTSGAGRGPSGGFRVFFEVMGFWTPEYVQKKLSRFDSLEDVAFIVAYDESLGVGESIEAAGHRAIPYRGTVRLKDVRDALRPYERALSATSASLLPDELVPDDDVTTIAAVAGEYGVPEGAVEEATFPVHERVGRTLVRPSTLADIADRLAAGMDLESATEVMEEYGVDDDGAVLSRLGYRVEWEGLGGGTVREK